MPDNASASPKGDNGHVKVDQNLIKILEEIPPGESRLVIFGCAGQLFKARFGQFSTMLYLWTSEGWQVFYRADRVIPEADIYDLAARSAVALATLNL